jgi:hypothetical protein
MAEKIKRNDLCPCGSGKKYKKCCIDKANSSSKVIDFAWSRLRKTEGEVVDKHLLPYIEKLSNKKELITEAWLDFFLDEDPAEEIIELLSVDVFIPWFLFNWIPYRYEDLESGDFEDKPIAMRYLEEHGRTLSNYQKDFIKAICKTHYSFYVVLDVVPEQSLLIKDILLQKEYLVKERSGTKYLQKGDVIFTRVLELDGQAICVGMAPRIIPAPQHLHLIEYRKELIEANDNKELSPSLLRNEFSEDVLFTFLEIIENLYSGPKVPHLHNTDDEPWQFCTVHFKLHCSPQEAFEALLPLTLDGTKEDFLENAKFNKSGKLEKISFPWLKKGNKKHKHWDNTVMGHMEINKEELIIEVNSESRAKKAQEKIKKYLGDRVKFKATMIKSLEQMTAESDNKKYTHEEKSLSVEQQDEAIKEFAQKHWDNWLTDKIPALNNMTPKQALQDQFFQLPAYLRLQ